MAGSAGPSLLREGSEQLPVALPSCAVVPGTPQGSSTMELARQVHPSGGKPAGGRHCPGASIDSSSASSSTSSTVLLRPRHSSTSPHPPAAPHSSTGFTPILAIVGRFCPLPSSDHHLPQPNESEHACARTPSSGYRAARPLAWIDLSVPGQREHARRWSIASPLHAV